jgi:hypothetical protein
MDQTTLVDIDFKKGEKVVSALEQAGVRVTVAMWVHFSEYEDWRFVLVSKDLDALDRGDAYLKVNRILKNAGISAWQVPLIFIMKATDPFIRALRKVFRKATDVTGMRLGGQRWGDRFVDDAYAYKIA